MSELFDDIQEVSFPNYPLPSGPDKPKLFFVDIPGARQSVIRIGKLAMPATDSDYDSASVMNSVLHFSAIQVLFGQKGYAYRVGTEIISHRNSSIFTAFSWVQPNATLESVQILRDLMLNYSELTILEKLESIKNAIVRWQAVNYETLSAKLSILNEMATYGFPNDYIKQREEIVKNVTLEEIQGLAQKYINPDQMIYLVVGDGVTQMKPLEKLGLGEPIRIEWK